MVEKAKCENCGTTMSVSSYRNNNGHCGHCGYVIPAIDKILKKSEK